MPLESLTCSACGSTDVQEVKTGTYFCSHCETVFKYHNPSVLTSSTAFCPCGNAIKFQCNSCQSGMCADCDAVEQAWSGRPKELIAPSHPGELFVRADAGYRSSREGGGLAWMPIVKLQTVLIGEKGSTVKHLCKTCANSACQIAYSRLLNGSICAALECASKPAVNCACCHLAFCGTCGRNRDAFRVLNLSDRVREHPLIPIVLRTGLDLCTPCMKEKVDVLLACAKTRFSLELLRMLGPDVYALPTQEERYTRPSNRARPPRRMSKRAVVAKSEDFTERTSECASELQQEVLAVGAQSCQGPNWHWVLECQ